MTIQRPRRPTDPDPLLRSLKEQYVALAPTLECLRLGLVEQMERVIRDNSLKLAFPIESRIKSWNSVEEKVTRNSLKPESIRDVQDLVGIRAVFLFLRDLRTARESVESTFTIELEDDVAGRLGESEFGYQSVHYGVKIPENWTTVPTFSGCGEIVAEVQLRTIAQHTWAAASHLLQYKNEAGVPHEVRRSIHRVSALLETVDLEFERALLDRDTYRGMPTPERAGDEELNVDLLESVLDEVLPRMNREQDEPYDEVLAELRDAGITTLAELRSLLSEQAANSVKHDAEIVEGMHDDKYGCEPDRIEQGVYLTHAGLIRNMLESSGISVGRRRLYRPFDVE